MLDIKARFDRALTPQGEFAPSSDDDVPNPVLPPTLVRLIVGVSGRHQIWLSVLSILVFVAETVPIEIQRRLVNAAVQERSARLVALLTGVYVAAILGQGLLKLALNVYRGWTGESVVRWMRRRITQGVRAGNGRHRQQGGIEIAMVVAEAEPIGGFVGDSVSIPLLQGGIMVGVFTYLTFLQPLMALIAALVFVPQFVLVPAVQHAINRRVAIRIWLLRKVSVAIVRETGSGEFDARTQNTRFNGVFELNMGIYKLKYTLNFLMNFLTSLSTAVTLGVGGYFVIKGQTEIGTVVAFVSGIVKITDPWGDLVNWFRDFRVTSERYKLIAHSLAG